MQLWQMDVMSGVMLVAPARLYVDSDGAVVFKSHRRTEDWPKAAKTVFEFLIDPVSTPRLTGSPPDGIPA